ncbi:NRDE family protein [Alteribacillus bidgolensis]|uniref:Uncharacterized conserved protein, contains NRDE domain n=1 Tax=Alteribacillus bidgolensis TaxID=930129 RepID=A0A1G8CC81_9BACI|nr:NRDE family protein [Alteribacillus bidgolensis]SDH43116.1 Uncharacterized conserved protein, contains NRDE domain [Alteribacillus bidgolensis]
MCLIVFGYGVHKDYPLIVAANRDEFYSRPTVPLHHWPRSPIKAGKDKEKGGTWMGVTESGRFAAITNVRASKQNPAKYSRGEIVKGFLEAEDPHTFLEECNVHNEDFDGYNLISGNSSQLYYSTNQDKHSKHKLKKGVYGLSNAFLNTPWPKVVDAKKKFTSILKKQTASFSPEPLFEMLSDTNEADEKDLPETGVDRQLEKKLSPLFIRMKGYGTRSQTVLVFTKKGEVIMEERTYSENGHILNQKNLNWTIK